MQSNKNINPVDPGKKTRKLKVYSKLRSRTYDITSIPEIRLEGRWLEKLGFA